MPIVPEHVTEVRSDVRFHPVLQEEADKSMNGHIAQKHIQQQVNNSSLRSLPMDYSRIRKWPVKFFLARLHAHALRGHSSVK